MSKRFDNMFHEMFNCSKTNECLTVMIVCSDSFGNCVGDNAVCWNTLGNCTIDMKYVESKWIMLKIECKKVYMSILL